MKTIFWKKVYWYASLSLILIVYAFLQKIPLNDFLIWIFAAIIYMLPTIIAYIKKDKALPPILIFNLAIGYTVFGWFIIMYFVLFPENK